MADDGHVVRAINWREAFPFTHLFRSFRIAINPSKLGLGLILLLSLYIGGRLLDWVWDEDDLAVPNEVQLYERYQRGELEATSFTAVRRAEREQLEERYANRLINEALVTERAAAVEAAEDGDMLGALKDRILTRRGEALKGIREAYNRDVERIRELTNDAEEQRQLALLDVQRAEAERDAYRTAYLDLRDLKQINGRGIFITFFEYETSQINGVVLSVLRGNWLGGMWGDQRPAGVLAHILNFIITGPLWLMKAHPFYFVLFFLLFLTVWAVFGGAISRIAAVHFARDEKLSVRAALHFSLGKFLSFLSAPLIPLILVLLVGLVPLVGGLVLSIPWVGPPIVGALFILLLLAGIVMTMVLIGTLGGFNLMYPTIAVEGSDSFDAISRSFSYIYVRPWRMLFLTLVAVVYGALTYLFVRLFATLTLGLTHEFVDWGTLSSAPDGRPLLEALWPMRAGELAYDVDYLTLTVPQDIGAGLIAFWVYLVIGLVGAYVISFYFSANTIIYYLLRREVDATDLDDVYLEESEEDFGETPPAASVTPPPAVTPDAPESAPASESASTTSTTTTSTSDSATAPPESAPPPPADTSGDTDARPL